MDTGDEQDFQFYPLRDAGVNDDKMTIGMGRAMVGLNRSSTADFFQRGSLLADTEIAIVAGALTLVATGAMSVAAAMLSLV